MRIYELTNDFLAEELARGVTNRDGDRDGDNAMKHQFEVETVRKKPVVAVKFVSFHHAASTLNFITIVRLLCLILLASILPLGQAFLGPGVPRFLLSRTTFPALCVMPAPELGRNNIQLPQAQKPNENMKSRTVVGATPAGDKSSTAAVDADSVASAKFVPSEELKKNFAQAKKWFDVAATGNFYFPSRSRI